MGTSFVISRVCLAKPWLPEQIQAPHFIFACLGHEALLCSANLGLRRIKRDLRCRIDRGGGNSNSEKQAVRKAAYRTGWGPLSNRFWNAQLPCAPHSSARGGIVKQPGFTPPPHTLLQAGNQSWSLARRWLLISTFVQIHPPQAPRKSSGLMMSVTFSAYLLVLAVTLLNALLGCYSYPIGQPLCV